ncbi:MAG TPA: ATP-binding protein [Opitutaceae bacterium]|jgi:PAS domain S-box-containing protein|nr:ATP-binding protein [Opitutaceae bacterium]
MTVLLGLVAFLLQSAHWVDHSDQVLTEANNVEKMIMTMQAGFRGFRLTSDRGGLETYTHAKDEVKPHLAALERLVADDPQQTTNTKRLEVSERAWAKDSDESIARLQAGQLPADQFAFLAAARTSSGSPTSIAQALLDEEERLRAERSADFARELVTIFIILGAAALVGVPMLVLWITRLVRTVETTYRASLDAIEKRAVELQVTLASIGDAVIAADSHGHISFLNSIATSLTGWSNEDAIGLELKTVFQVFNEDTGAPGDDPSERVLRENRIVKAVDRLKLRNRNGTDRPVEISAAPIRGQNEQKPGVILVFRDVSEKRSADRVLRESERRLRFLHDLAEATRTLVDSSEIMSVSTRMLGEHLNVSRCAYAEMIESSKKFTIFDDYTHECQPLAGTYELSAFGSHLEQELTAGRTLVINDVNSDLAFSESAPGFNSLGIRATVCYPLMKDSSLRAMMAVHSATPRSWTAQDVSLVGEVVERCWATIQRSLAEGVAISRGRVAEAQALAASESANRFQLLSEVIAIQVWTATPTGELDYANQGCLEYFGGDLERDILGHAWAQYVHADDLSGATSAWKHSLSTGEPYEVEFRLLGRRGTYRWFLARARAMRDTAGAIVKWFGTNTDIDELKRARDTAEKASRAKDEFLAALSHELRTPLTPVLLTVSEMREDTRLSSDIREQLGMMERNIALEARLIDDLLDLTTISRGKLQLRAQPCDAHSLIGLAIEIVRSDAASKQVSVRRDLKAALYGLNADPARFQQVIWNLLRNSVKFTEAGGTITIKTANELNADGSQWLRIEVTDTGIGFGPAFIDQIFQPFDQGEHSGTHRFGGVGLGLAIARAIVDLHGGRISAKSDGTNKGSTFVVELPGAAAISGAAGGPAATPAAPAAAAQPPPLRLLIVDDHANTLQSLRHLLKRRGHEVVTAGNVTDALSAASRETFDLVISDLGLPDGSGTELMEKLRDTYGLRGIALSGYGLEDDLARTQKAGFVAHLVKPVQFAELNSIISSLPRR